MKVQYETYSINLKKNAKPKNRIVACMPEQKQDMLRPTTFAIKVTMKR